MENKTILIKFHRGVSYEIPATYVAMKRANYYSCEVDGHEIDSQEYLDEINYALNNEFELFDWIKNNMNWEDLYLYAKKIKDDPIDLEDEWSKGNHILSLKK